MKNLEVQINEEVRKGLKGMPNGIKNYLKTQIRLGGSKLKPLSVGDKLPEGNLLDNLGNQVKLSDYLNNQPAIINFYRGSWCPYCNLELAFYDELLGEEKNINMIAISPEKPDVTEEAMDVSELNFKVLSDVNNTFAHKMKLVYKASKLMKFLMKVKGGDLKKSQGNTNGELPIPGTYIVDKNGVIRHSWIDSDFTKRGEPEEVVEAYKKLLKK